MNVRADVWSALTPSRQLGDEDRINSTGLCERHNLVALETIILGARRVFFERADGLETAVPIEPPAPKRA